MLYADKTPAKIVRQSFLIGLVFPLRYANASTSLLACDHNYQIVAGTYKAFIFKNILNGVGTVATTRLRVRDFQQTIAITRLCVFNENAVIEIMQFLYCGCKPANKLLCAKNTNVTYFVLWLQLIFNVCI